MESTGARICSTTQPSCETPCMSWCSGSETGSSKSMSLTGAPPSLPMPERVRPFDSDVMTDPSPLTFAGCMDSVTFHTGNSKFMSLTGISPFLPVPNEAQPFDSDVMTDPSSLTSAGCMDVVDLHLLQQDIPPSEGHCMFNCTNLLGLLDACKSQVSFCQGRVSSFTLSTPSLQYIFDQLFIASRRGSAGGVVKPETVRADDSDLTAALGYICVGVPLQPSAPLCLIRGLRIFRVSVRHSAAVMPSLACLSSQSMPVFLILAPTAVIQRHA